MTGSDSAHDLDLLDRLIEEFNGRLRRGERPSVQEFCDRHPHLADDLRELLPAVAVVEQIKAEPAAELAAPAKMPEDFGDFHFLREVGHGGMGVVYEAEQVSLGRRVALKVLTKKMLLDARHKRRFEREARAAAKLHHTNIVPVFGVGEADGVPYYVMQFIQGQGLDKVVEELRRLRSGTQAEATSVTAPRPPRRDVSAEDVARSLMTGDFDAGSNGTGDFMPPPLPDAPADGAPSPGMPSESA